MSAPNSNNTGNNRKKKPRLRIRKVSKTAVRKLVLRCVVAVILLALLLGLWFGLAWPAFKNHQEKKFITLAEQAWENGDYNTATLSARNALKNNKASIPASKMMIRLAERSRSTRTLNWRARLVELEPNLENKLLLASTALKIQSFPYPTTQQILEEVQSEAENDVSYHMLAGELALKSKDFAKAEKHYQRTVELEPENDVHKMNLAGVQINSSNTNLVLEAEQSLISLRESPRIGEYVLRTLVSKSLATADLESALNYSNQLLAGERSAFGDQLLHLTILKNQNSSEFIPYLSDLKKSATENPSYAYLLASWLRLNDKSAEALTWLSGLDEKIQTTLPVPLAIADCLLENQNWQALIHLLEDTDWRGQDYMRLAILAKATRETQKDMAFQDLWNKSVQATRYQLQFLTTLARLSASWNWQEESKQVLWDILQRYPDQSWPIDVLYRNYIASKNTPGIYRIYRVMLKRKPDNLIFKNNVAMIALLLNTDTQEAHKLASEVYESDPKNAGYLSTMAFSLHLQGKTTQALEMFRNVPEASRKNPVLAPYYAIILAAYGERQEAKAYFKLMDESKLLPEEIQMFRNSMESL